MGDGRGSSRRDGAERSLRARVFSAASGDEDMAMIDGVTPVAFRRSTGPAAWQGGVIAVDALHCGVGA
jgi:hypothetical protein